MRWTARWGLDRLACVSNAVQQACRAASYPGHKLVVVHNGVPASNHVPKLEPAPCLRLGYLGVLSESKGIGVAFEILDRVSRLGIIEWEFHVAGATQQGSAEKFIRELRSKYQATQWQPRIHWHGWINRPIDVVRSLDLLIFPSIAFDSFPNVLLEAALTGTPVFASNVGGVPEIVQDGESGWLFDTARVADAAALLADLLRHPETLRAAGEKARLDTLLRFRMEAMIAGYQAEYKMLARIG